MNSFELDDQLRLCSMCPAFLRDAAWGAHDALLTAGLAAVCAMNIIAVGGYLPAAPVPACCLAASVCLAFLLGARVGRRT